jgi:hypothetical protein
MPLRPLRTVLTLAVVILVGVMSAGIYAQNTITSSASAWVSNITQWGTTSVTPATALTDAVGNPTVPLVGATNLYWSTSAWERARTASLGALTPSSTLTGRNALGVQMVEKGGRWGGFSNPAAGAQATYSIAAEAAVRHVADCISFSAVATTAPALTALTVQLRDGATGAGTVLQQWQVVAVATATELVAPFGLCGLNLVGTTNTAMTLEFSAALANLIQSVNLTGYNVS